MCIMLVADITIQAGNFAAHLQSQRQLSVALLTHNDSIDYQAAALEEKTRLDQEWAKMVSAAEGEGGGLLPSN